MILSLNTDPQSIFFYMQRNLYTLSIYLLNDKSHLRDCFFLKLKDFINGVTTSFTSRCSISSDEDVFFFPSLFCIKCLHKKKMWSPKKMFVMQKKRLLIAAPASRDNTLRWPVLNLSEVEPQDRTLSPALALPRYVPCFIVLFRKQWNRFFFFYHCNVVNFVPVFCSVQSQMYDLVTTKNDTKSTYLSMDLCMNVVMRSRFSL